MQYVKHLPESTASRATSSHRLSSSESAKNAKTATLSISHNLEQLAEKDGFSLAEWCRKQRAEVVKTGRHRTVYHLNLPSGGFYLKHYKCPDWRTRLKNMFRPAKALTEQHNANMVAGLGIPTVEVVATGFLNAGSSPKECYLVSRAIEATVPLDRVVRDPDRYLNSGRTVPIRRNLALELARLTARLHGGKLSHGDFHSGNLLLHLGDDDSVKVWLIDLYEVKSVRRGLSSRQILRHLAQLNMSMMHVVTPSDRLRFFRCYWEQLQAANSQEKVTNSRLLQLSFAAACRKVDRFCKTATWRAKQKKDRKWESGNRHLIIADTKQLRCRGVAEIGREELFSLRDNPRQLLSSPFLKQLKQETNASQTADISLSLSGTPTPCLLENFHPISDSRKPCRDAYQNWAIGHAFLRRGISTPRPLFFLSAHQAHNHRQYLVTEAVPDSQTLTKFLHKSFKEMSHSRQERWLLRFLDRLGHSLRKMHFWRYEHTVLDADSILVSRQPDSDRLWFLNVDAVRQRRFMTRRCIQRNLWRLHGDSLRFSSIRNTHRLRFLNFYLGDRFSAEWKQYWRAISRLNS